jgi:hypothetical protein
MNININFLFKMKKIMKNNANLKKLLLDLLLLKLIKNLLFIKIVNLRFQNIFKKIK